MGAHQNPVQRAVVLGIAVISTGLNGTFDALVGIIIHKNASFYIGFGNSMAGGKENILKESVEIAFLWFVWYFMDDDVETVMYLYKGEYSMAKLSPSILSADFANLERDIHDIEKNGADWVHVDVMDGIFVPNISIGIPVVQAIRPVTDLPLDVHLMIDRPIRYVEQFVKAGADWLTIHIEADQPQNTLEALDKILALGCKAAISLKPKTPAEAAIPYLEKCDMILVMTVEPGFGGQKFMADQMDKIKQLREWLDDINPECVIEVDGGVDANTCAVCKENGAEVLVAGSAYFKASDRAAFVKTIQA